VRLTAELVLGLLALGLLSALTLVLVKDAERRRWAQAAGSASLSGAIALGFDTVGVLLTTPLGWACLGVGSGLPTFGLQIASSPVCALS